MTPKVSICVPNLNTRPFLPERFQTIQAQSLNDWELLVYDSHSTDGAWEVHLRAGSGEPRMRAWQGPREGTPGSWSPCVAQAPWRIRLYRHQRRHDASGLPREARGRPRRAPGLRCGPLPLDAHRWTWQ